MTGPAWEAVVLTGDADSKVDGTETADRDGVEASLTPDDPAKEGGVVASPWKSNRRKLGSAKACNMASLTVFTGNSDSAPLGAVYLREGPSKGVDDALSNRFDLRLGPASEVA